MAALTKDAVGGSQNLIAFLDTIAVSEIGADLLAASDDGYNVIVGSTAAHPILFNDYAQHPNVLMPFKLKNGQIQKSSAAGRYQTLHSNAVYYTKLLTLHDFGKVNQDRIALQLLREVSADKLLKDNKFLAAIHAANSRWASFPGAGYGQNENAIELLASAYTKAGGTIGDM